MECWVTPRKDQLQVVGSCELECSRATHVELALNKRDPELVRSIEREESPKEP
jgi:hypothetical protein